MNGKESQILITNVKAYEEVIRPLYNHIAKLEARAEKAEKRAEMTALLHKACDSCEAELARVRDALRDCYETLSQGSYHNAPCCEKAKAALDSTSPQTCAWREDEDGVWETACGEAFSFDYDGPVENKTRYCQYCGKPVDVKQIGHVGEHAEKVQEHAK